MARRPGRIDAMLDYYNELSGEIRGALAAGRIQKVNARLRQRFSRFVLETGSDGIVRVLPIIGGYDVLDDSLLCVEPGRRAEITPPVRRLSVPVRNGRNTHEYRRTK